MQQAEVGKGIDLACINLAEVGKEEGNLVEEEAILLNYYYLTCLVIARWTEGRLVRSTEERGGRTLAHVADSPHHLIKTTHTHTQSTLPLVCRVQVQVQAGICGKHGDGMGK